MTKNIGQAKPTKPQLVPKLRLMVEYVGQGGEIFRPVTLPPPGVGNVGISLVRCDGALFVEFDLAAVTGHGGYPLWPSPQVWRGGLSMLFGPVSGGARPRVLAGHFLWGWWRLTRQTLVKTFNTDPAFSSTLSWRRAHRAAQRNGTPMERALEENGGADWGEMPLAVLDVLGLGCWRGVRRCWSDSDAVQRDMIEAAPWWGGDLASRIEDLDFPDVVNTWILTRRIRLREWVRDFEVLVEEKLPLDVARAMRYSRHLLNRRIVDAFTNAIKNDCQMTKGERKRLVADKRCAPFFKAMDNAWFIRLLAEAGRLSRSSADPRPRGGG